MHRFTLHAADGSPVAYSFAPTWEDDRMAHGPVILLHREPLTNAMRRDILADYERAFARRVVLLPAATATVRVTKTTAGRYVSTTLYALRSITGKPEILRGVGEREMQPYAVEVCANPWLPGVPLVCAQEWLPGDTENGRQEVKRMIEESLDLRYYVICGANLRFAEANRVAREKPEKTTTDRTVRRPNKRQAAGRRG